LKEEALHIGSPSNKKLSNKLIFKEEALHIRSSSKEKLFR